MNKISASPNPDDSSEFLLYQTEDGQTRVQVRVLDETVWLTQRQLAELFQKDVRTVNEHIQNVYEEGELDREPTIRKFRIVHLIVDQYLSFAELQARQRKPMTMSDWRTKLDAFLTLNDRDILTNSGAISADDAKEIAAREYEKFDAQRRRLEAESPTGDFEKFVERVKQLPPQEEQD